MPRIMSPNPFRWNFRAQMLLGFLCCAALLGYALHVQYNMLMFPCPLCILQRVAFVAMGAVFLLAGLHSPGSFGRKVYGLLIALAAACGAGIAAWHLNIQYMPTSEIAMCSGLGLDYMLEALPLQEVIQRVFTPSGECAKIDWKLFGLSMPGWTLLWYLGLGAGTIWSAFRRR